MSRSSEEIFENDDVTISVEECDGEVIVVLVSDTSQYGQLLGTPEEVAEKILRAANRLRPEPRFGITKLVGV